MLCRGATPTVNALTLARGTLKWCRSLLSLTIAPTWCGPARRHCMSREAARLPVLMPFPKI
eukprot:6213118-Pleurochrysis_carterae.AAC.3